MFVIVRIESLKEFSKFIESNNNIPERIKRLKKKETKIKKDNFTFVGVILLSE